MGEGAVKPTDCPTCGRSLKHCQDSRARGWDNCCLTCDEIGQMENHRTLYVPEGER